jgi:glyoxylase I family protein
MIRVTAFSHVSVLVGDTTRAVAFYHGVLGLPVCPDRPSLSVPGAWLELGQGRQLHLLEAADAGRDEPGRHGGRDWHVALEVADLDEAIATLEAAGIAFTRSRSGRRALFCRDPDGNAIELLEPA